ncbi:hypothetical protein EZS27_015315 [termite gut metagenome]|uniref:DUF2975 domain-containing protein n=1 Tax=termite gut metagenome TaxID=433724 RepID=A0A5J4RT17_9ZZZZ
MEAQIKQVLKILYIQFFFFMLIPALLAVVYETNILPVGIYADDIRIRYLIESTGILVTIVCVPLVFVLFRFMQKRKIENNILPVALDRYVYLCAGRLALLEMVVILNVVASYMTLNNSSGHCVLIALIASLFCLPSKKRLYADLKLQQPDGNETKSVG